MYGEHVQELNVYIVTEWNGEKNLAFRRTGEQGQFWDRAVVQASVSEDKPFQFIIEGVTSNLEFTDIAIDDLSFTQVCQQVNTTLPIGSTPMPPYNPCTDEEFYCRTKDECIPNANRCDWKADCSNKADEENCGECDFEYGMCDWSDVSEGLFQWKRIIAKSVSPYEHPHLDHTYGVPEGHYACIEGAEGIEGKTAVMVSPPVQHTTGYYCELHFWVYVNHGMNAHLALYYHNDYENIDHLLYNSTYSVDEELWYEVIAPARLTPKKAYFKFTATPVFDQSSDWAASHSALAIDDIDFFNCNELLLGLDCDFEEPKDCNWRQDQSAEQEWRMSDIYHSQLTDHTTGQGKYIYVDFVTPANKGDKARILSTAQSEPNNAKSVFSLWYYFYGENVGIFRIIQMLQNTKQNETLFELKDSQEDRWMLFEKSLEPNDDFTIIIEAEWEEAGLGLVAVDDIKMTSKLSQALCDFEEDFCQWKQGEGGTTVWKRDRGKHNVTENPPVDHSTNTEMGYYAYLKIKAKPERMGFLESPLYESVGVQCLRFWYHLLGEKVGDLAVALKDPLISDKFIPVWSHGSNTFEMWSLGMVTLPDLQKFVVRFEGITGTNNMSSIALDDIEFIPGTCPRRHVCDFEYDLCDWYNTDNGDDSFDWTRATGIEGKGPLVDHTINYDTGHYMLAKLEGKKKGDSAKLFSGTVPARRKCITLWYSMQHIVNATLSINLVGQGDGDPLLEVYNSSLEYLWEEAVITADITTDSYVVAIVILVDEDITFSEYDAVAIDDVAFTENCQVITLPPPFTTFEPAHLPTVYDCDFEKKDSHICYWEQDKDDGFDWRYWQGTPPDGMETGPDTDHTTMAKDGHYVYAFPNEYSNEIARLISPDFDVGTSAACLSFWYHMHGFEVGKLTVKMQTDSNHSKALWERSGDQSHEWIQGKVQFSNGDSGKMILEAHVKYAGRGNIAIDDILFDFNPCKTSGLCDFENGMCHFEQSLEDETNWDLVAASLDEELNVPSSDHSNQEAGGHYIRLTDSGTSVIFTNEFDPKYGCVEFWVYLNGYEGYDASTLTVYSRLDGNTNPEPLLYIGDTLGPSWNRYVLPVSLPKPYSLAFEGTVRGGQYIIGLDDIQPRLTCEPMSECNFEKDLCMWKNIAEDDFDWILGSGDQLTNVNAPPVDVTLGSPYGSYAFVDTYSAVNKNNITKGVLESNVMEAEDRCVSFWYHIQSSGSPSLTLSVRNVYDTQFTDVWTHSGTLMADWTFVQVNISKYERYGLRLSAASDHGEVGVIALDDVKVESGLCSNSSQPDCVTKCDNLCIHEEQMCDFIQDCSLAQDERFCGYNCTFEQKGSDQEHCQWKTINEDDSVFIWQQFSGQMNNTFGPPLDHTFLSPEGHYMAVVPMTFESREGDQAILQSPKLRNSAGYCRMHFYYIMYGSTANDIGTVRVIYQVDDITVEVVKFIGDRGDEWREGIAYIGRISKEFHVMFEGVRNLEVGGYIAVDDILFENCFLPTPQDPGECTEYGCVNMACVSKFEQCDFVDDCGDYSDEDTELADCYKFYARCDFENGNLCEWYTDNESYWLLGSPDTQDIIPPRDHTTNTALGIYLYIESTQSNSNATSGSLISPVIKWERYEPTAPPCILRFFYYIDGPAVDTLVVSTRSTVNGPLTAHLTIKGAVGPYWERAEVYVPPHYIMDNPVQYVIKAATLDYEKEQRSVIAIDDISFSETCGKGGYLPTGPPVVTTTTSSPCSSDYQCENGACIPLDRVCNFIDECMDNSDERMCAECTFDDGICGWQDQSYGAYFWSRDEDPTEGIAGQVMIAEERFGGISPSADLVSVSLGRSYVSCLMSFHYYKRGGENGGSALRAYVKTKLGNEYTIWSVLSDMGTDWHEQIVGIGEHEAGWSLKFEADNYEKEGLIMIDNIHFINCSVPEPTVCKPDEFSCLNGNCIDYSALCDFSDDCGDNTDELDLVCEKYQEKCTFEEDFCRWEQESSELLWIRKNGDTLAEDVGPDYDHTYGNDTGYYLYLESVIGSTGKYGRISSTSFYPSAGECEFRFWYMIRAQQNVLLTVYAVETSVNSQKLQKEIFHTTGSKEYLWEKVSVPVNFARYFKIMYEGKVGEPVNGDIAIDDISFSPDCQITTLPPGQCQEDEFQCVESKACIIKTKVCDFRYDCQDASDEVMCPSYCNFEMDSCGWQEAVNDSLNWVVAKANDSSFGTENGGPYEDATHLKAGHFLLLYKTKGNVEDQEGYAHTHWYQNSAPACRFKYWYYMNGVLGSDVVLRLNITPEIFTNLTFFTANANEDGEWLSGEVGIGRQKSPFQVSLYKIPSNDYYGKFAIDEMKFENDCHYPDPQPDDCELGFLCPVTEVCVPLENVCDMSDDCGEGEDEASAQCKEYHRYTLEDNGWEEWFEQGQNGVDDDFDWTLWNGSTVTLGMGPNFDHTTFSHVGHYFYLDSSFIYNKVAWLKTKPMKTESTCFFSFYTHMYGEEIGYLSIFLKDASSATNLLMNMTGSQGNVWRKVTFMVDSGSVGEEFQLIIEGRVGEKVLGDIAIDDFVFAPECSLVTPPPRNCTAGEYRCKSGTCLPITSRCNFVVECPDGDTSDEDGCVSHKCNFEGRDICNWQVKSNDHGTPQRKVVFTWEFLRGVEVANNSDQMVYQPPMDHTHADADSYYMFTSAVKGEYEDSTDLIMSIPIGTTNNFCKPKIGESGTTCRLRIWYWLYGVTPGSLHVGIVSGSEEVTEKWMTDGNHEKNWNVVEVPLGHVVDQRVSITAKRGRVYEGAGALDDVEFVDCAPPVLPPSGLSCSELSRYECNTGACIDSSLACDYSDDCLDLSDELGSLCASFKYRCDFEHGLCSHWTEEVVDNANWILLKASADPLGTLPNGDHTHSTSDGRHRTVKASSAPQLTALLRIRPQGISKRTGHYMVFNGLPTKASIELIAQLHSPVLRGTSAKCSFRFWYQVRGPNPGTIKVYRRYSYYEDGLTLIKEMDMSVKNIWLRADFRVHNATENKDYQIVLEGRASQDYIGSLAVDDFSMTPLCEESLNQNLPGEDHLTTPVPICPPGELACDNGQCYNPAVTCNFLDDCGDGTDEKGCTKSCDFEPEGDTCGWFESQAVSVHWNREGFPANPPGPENDHAHGTHSHDLASFKSGGSAGQLAILESHTFSSVSRSCVLSFWHYLATTGSTPVFLGLFRKSEQDAASGNPPEQLWSGSSETSGWKRQFIKLNGKRDFTLQFQAVHEDGDTHIALDDIRFEDCAPHVNECQNEIDFACEDGSCIARQHRCDAQYDCFDKSDEFQCPSVKGNCDFDSMTWPSDCAYKQREDDDLDWLQASSSGMLDVGPDHDHTLGSSGHYLYVTNFGGVQGLLASIMPDQKYPASKGVCYIRFWYYMHTSHQVAENVDLGTLRVYLEDDAGERLVVSVRSGNQVKNWLEEIILVEADEDFHIVFEAETGTSQDTYIALDDVSLTPECESGVGPPPTNTTCPIGELPCNVGGCVPADFFCDCFYDCVDGSDEFGCNKTPCDPGFFYCADYFMQEHPCLPVEDLCDGRVNCHSHSADESLCGECPSNYCQNGGQCNYPDGPPLCDCPGQYTGDRCEVLAGTDITTSSSISPGTPGGLKAGAIVGIVLGVLAVLICLALGGYYYWKKKQYSSPQPVQSDWDNPRNQPYFGLDIPLPTADEYPLEDLSSSSTTGVSNPSFLADHENPVSDL
nr:MAM and LDL-receptor class A domain-containing protein 1-like [Penaeus vannamei]